MIRSMTGYARASARTKRGEVVVELASVNNRFFKAAWKMPDCLLAHREEMEGLIRRSLPRGSVTVAVSLVGEEAGATWMLDGPLLDRLLDSAASLARRRRLDFRPDLNALLVLPGVVKELPAAEPVPAPLWRAIRSCLERALRQLSAMRAREGRHLLRDMRARLRRIGRLAAQAEGLTPGVVRAYQARLRDRVAALLGDQGASLSPADLAREVALFADRCDVSEELTRIRAHLSALEETLRQGEEAGRKVEFLLQELQRETNTLGAKASDGAIGSLVVEMKGEIEKVREQIQNVE